MKKPELLAPAGDYTCFQAALKAGADAVYIGGQRFGARAYAGNFSDTEVVDALKEAHFYGKRLYLTVNTLLKQNEIGELEDFIGPFYEAGLDGVIAVSYTHLPSVSRRARDCFVKTVLQLFNCFTVIAKTHPESPFAMDFGNPESLSYGQRKALACAAECAGLFEQ